MARSILPFRLGHSADAKHAFRGMAGRAQDCHEARIGQNCSMNALQEVKELVRGTRQAVGSNFLGSLESFLVYLESLMDYCKMFLADSAAEAVMKVWR